MFKISAIICTYNRAFFLEKSLMSLIQQTIPDSDFEIIIVDNNSTDGTREVFEKYQKNHPSYTLRYILEKNQGLSYARNTGWKNAQSPYVYYLDDDGVASNGLLEEFLRLFDDPENKVVACGGKIDVSYDPFRPDWLPKFFERFYGEYERGEHVEECNYVPGGNSAWAVKFLRESNGFDEQLGRVKQDGAGCEESLLNIRAIKSGKKLIYSPKALMVHYAGPSRLNLKWLLQRMKGQGKSSATLILINSQNKRNSALATLKKDFKEFIFIILAPRMKEPTLSKEIVSRIAFSTEKFYRIAHMTKFLLQ